MTFEDEPWPVASPFIDRRVVVEDDLDAFRHVNNVRYIDWAMQAAWAHSNAVGLTFAAYERLGVGCVVRRHEFDYLAPASLGDDIAVATWFSENDNRVRLTRSFDIRRAPTGETLFKGRTLFVTIDMASGKPARMPKEFIEGYKIAE